MRWYTANKLPLCAFQSTDQFVVSYGGVAVHPGLPLGRVALAEWAGCDGGMEQHNDRNLQSTLSVPWGAARDLFRPVVSSARTKLRHWIAGLGDDHQGGSGETDGSNTPNGYRTKDPGNAIRPEQLFHVRDHFNQWGCYRPLRRRQQL